VMLGAMLMSAGHIAMAFDASFLLALFLLIVGCGLLKGNISAQVGQLYSEQDGAGRTRGFSIYSIGINVGAVAGPLACGLLAQLYGWHAGFGLAGILMLLGLLTYILGYRTLMEETPKSNTTQAVAPVTPAQWRAVAALAVAMALTIFQSIAYYQNGNINLVWIDKYVDLNFLGFHVPPSWFNSIDPFISIIFVPPLFALWKWQQRHGGEPDEIMKISQGAFITALANLILVAGCLMWTHVPVIFPILYDVLLGIGFLYYWPPLLALVSRVAPPSLKSTLMGCAFLSLFVSNIAIGWIGGFYEHMSPTNFWALNVIIPCAGGVLAFLLARPLNRTMNVA
jgi:POT family proton-dependent oligopeptide transporter